MTIRVSVDHELCIGSGNCIHLAKSAFELNDDGLAEVTDQDAASEEELLLAARACPTSAILVDGEGDQGQAPAQAGDDAAGGSSG
jgi:ferredoxin